MKPICLTAHAAEPCAERGTTGDEVKASIEPGGLIFINCIHEAAHIDKAYSVLWAPTPTPEIEASARKRFGLLPGRHGLPALFHVLGHAAAGEYSGLE